MVIFEKLSLFQELSIYKLCQRVICLQILKAETIFGTNSIATWEQGHLSWFHPPKQSYWHLKGKSVNHVEVLTKVWRGMAVLSEGFPWADTILHFFQMLPRQKAKTKLKCNYGAFLFFTPKMNLPISCHDSKRLLTKFFKFHDVHMYLKYQNLFDMLVKKGVKNYSPVILNIYRDTEVCYAQISCLSMVTGHLAKPPWNMSYITIYWAFMPYLMFHTSYT